MITFKHYSTMCKAFVKFINELTEKRLSYEKGSKEREILDRNNDSLEEDIGEIVNRLDTIKNTLIQISNESYEYEKEKEENKND